jgi:hypothetical protein
MVGKKRPWAVLTVALISLAGCTKDTASKAPTWNASAPPASPPAWTEPAGYSFVLESTCGERPLVGKFRVAVANGAVTTVDGLDTAAKRSLEVREADLVPTVGQLMTEAETAREDGAEVVQTDHDPVDGHPTLIRIDRVAGETADESCYTITEYTKE